MLDKVCRERNNTQMIIDFYSTNSDMFGNQENTGYNAHYGHTGLSFVGGLRWPHRRLSDFMKAELRSSNVYTSKGVKDFLAPMLTHYRQVLPCTDILVRGESGYATPEIHDTCESNESFYVIRLKTNRVVEKTAESFVLVGDNHPREERDVHYYSAFYQANSWSEKCRICIKLTREANKLVFSHEYVVTNFHEEPSVKTIFQFYHKRGTMENFIKEAKNGFYFDKN